MLNLTKIKQFDVLVEPLITEKSNKLIEASNSYTFRVKKDATKPEIKAAVESIFKVTVLKVRTVISPAKKKTVGRYQGMVSAFKKAIVTLKEGDKIAEFTI